MRGFLWVGLASIAAVALSVLAPASADVLSEYQRFAARHLRPAPLVPTAVPGVLSPLARTFTLSGSRSRSGYAWRLVHYSPSGPDAIIALERGAFKTIAATLCYHRRLGFKSRPTRVRGHRGYLLTRKLGPTQWSLVWMEGGTPARQTSRCSAARATRSPSTSLRTYFVPTPGAARSRGWSDRTRSRLNLHASGVFDGSTCDTGAVSLTLDQHAI
jgi:hypothetical protein